MPEPRTNGSGGLDARVTRAESSVEWIRGETQALQARLQEVGTRAATDVEKLQASLGSQIEALRKEAEAARRPNWQLLISGGFLVLALWGASMIPLQQTGAMNTKAIDKINLWQDQYMLGHIPNSAEPTIATLKQQMTDAEAHNWERSEQNRQGLHTLDDRVRQLEIDFAELRAHAAH